MGFLAVICRNCGAGIRLADSGSLAPEAPRTVVFSRAWRETIECPNCKNKHEYTDRDADLYRNDDDTTSI